MNFRLQNRLLFAFLLLAVVDVSSPTFFNDADQDQSYLSGFLNGIKVFSSGFGDVMRDTLRNAGKLMKFAIFASKFLDSSIEEDCTFECPPGKIAMPRLNHVGQHNGCGSMGFLVGAESLPHPAMEDCCNQHDLCYDTCGRDREQCDKLFRRCLYQTCGSSTNNPETSDFVFQKKCQSGAKILYTTTMALGCMSYRDAQQQACLCVPQQHYQQQKEPEHKQQQQRYNQQQRRQQQYSNNEYQGHRNRHHAQEL